MKKLISLLTMIVMLLSMTGCDDKEKKPEMDPEAAGEFVVDYMKEKYDVDFEINSSHKPMGQSYFEIRGTLPNMTYELEFKVSYDEENKKYIVTNDLYFQEAIHTIVDKWTNDLYGKYCKFNKGTLFCYTTYVGYSDVEENVPVNIETILSAEKNALFQYYLIIPEDEFGSEIDVTTKVERLITHLNEIGNDYSFEIYVFKNELYNKISDNATYLDFYNKFMFQNKIDVIKIK